jgi:biopolymer transport protein ExbB/TolQ
MSDPVNAEMISDGILLALAKIFLGLVLAAIAFGVFNWFTELPRKMAEKLTIERETNPHRLRDWAIGGGLALALVLITAVLSTYSK